MLILNDPTLINRIPDIAIRNLLQQRFSEICAGEPYNYDLHGYMIVVEPGDSIESLESETCCSIIHNAFDDTHYGQVDFTPCFEALEEHSHCFEMLFILNDEGFAIDIFIPKHSEIDPQLLTLCTEYAVPAVATTHP